jgi:hypothetical protein
LGHVLVLSKARDVIFGLQLLALSRELLIILEVNCQKSSDQTEGLILAHAELLSLFELVAVNVLLDGFLVALLFNEEYDLLLKHVPRGLDLLKQGLGATTSTQ